MRWRAFAELRAERMEVVPQRDDLRRRTRGEQSHVRPHERDARRLRRCEHVAGVLDDPSAVERAESCTAIRIPEAYPVRHCRRQTEEFAARLASTATSAGHVFVRKKIVNATWIAALVHPYFSAIGLTNSVQPYCSF